MNERIKELALEAFQPINSMASEGVADYYTFQEPWFQMYNQKFAELLVHDFIKIVDNHDKKIDPDDLIVELKRHFGIE